MASVIKLKRTSTASSVPSTSDLELGELALNTNDGKLFFKKDDGTTSIQEIVPFNPAAVTQDIVPATNETVNLGTADKRFGELFLAGNTINIGGATISSDGSGQIQISANGAVLPAGSKVSSGTVTQEIATVATTATASFTPPTPPAPRFSIRCCSAPSSTTTSSCSTTALQST